MIIPDGQDHMDSKLGYGKAEIDEWMCVVGLWLPVER